jgi:hypothetical protein
MSILSQQNCHLTGVVKGICGPPKGMKMASVPQPLFMEASLSPLSPEWSMGLRPTQGDEKRLLSGTLSMKASPSPLSSRAQPRDPQFREPFLEMFFDRAYTDFLLRGTNRSHVCGFTESRMNSLIRQVRQEIRGSVVEVRCGSTSQDSRAAAPLLFHHAVLEARREPAPCPLDHRQRQRLRDQQ